MAIARYLARQFHLAGSDNLEQAKVDAVVDTISDLLEAFFIVLHEENPSKHEELVKKFKAEDIPKHLKTLDASSILFSNGGPFFVGGILTWTDLFFHAVTEDVLQIDLNAFEKYPWLKVNRAESGRNPMNC